MTPIIFLSLCLTFVEDAKSTGAILRFIALPILLSVYNSYTLVAFLQGQNVVYMTQGVLLRPPPIITWRGTIFSVHTVRMGEYKRMSVQLCPMLAFNIFLTVFAQHASLYEMII